MPLFRRLTREIRLTGAGQGALPLITEGFDSLADGVARIVEYDETGILTVTAAPTFAAKWLVPRLAYFNDLYPDLSVRIDSSLQLLDYERDGIHIGVRLGAGNYPDMRVEKLFDETVIPAFAPSLLEGPHPLTTLDNLKHHRLLHVDWSDLPNAPTWQVWLDHYGIEDVDASRGPVFTIEMLAIQAAIGGQGVVLVSTIGIQEDLAASRLVAPFDLPIPSHSAFWVVAPARMADRPKVRAFRERLFEEAQAA